MRTLFVLLVVVTIAGCGGNSDRAELLKRIDALEARVSELESGGGGSLWKVDDDGNVYTDRIVWSSGFVMCDKKRTRRASLTNGAGFNDKTSGPGLRIFADDGKRLLMHLGYVSLVNQRQLLIYDDEGWPTIKIEGRGDEDDGTITAGKVYSKSDE